MTTNSRPISFPNEPSPAACRSNLACEPSESFLSRRSLSRRRHPAAPPQLSYAKPMPEAMSRARGFRAVARPVHPVQTVATAHPDRHRAAAARRRQAAPTAQAVQAPEGDRDRHPEEPARRDRHRAEPVGRAQTLGGGLASTTATARAGNTAAIRSVRPARPPASAFPRQRVRFANPSRWAAGAMERRSPSRATALQRHQCATWARAKAFRRSRPAPQSGVAGPSQTSEPVVTAPPSPRMQRHRAGGRQAAKMGKL